MRVTMQPGAQGPRQSPREHMLHALRAFPKPIAVARNPRLSHLVLVSFQDENGQPYSIELTYLGTHGEKLLVRTKAAPATPGESPAPTITTVDTLQTSFGIYGRDSVAALMHRRATDPRFDISPHELISRHRSADAEYAAMPQRSVTVQIDAAAVPGTRIDFPDCSGVELTWNGQVVHCVAVPGIIDELELHSGSDEELASLLPL
jgi:hypothetical protein